MSAVEELGGAGPALARLPVPRLRRWPWFTAMLLGGAALLTFVPDVPAWAQWTGYESEPVSHGAAWVDTLRRALTCHGTHFGARHFALNALALAVLGLLVERRRRWCMVLTTALAALAIPFAVSLLEPDLNRYRGASGVASAWLVLVLLDRWRELRSPLTRTGISLCAGAFALKLGWEWVGGEALFAHSASAPFVVVPVAHVAGVAAALFVVVAERLTKHAILAWRRGPVEEPVHAYGLGEVPGGDSLESVGNLGPRKASGLL